MLTVTTASTDPQLTSTAAVRELLGLTTDETSDDGLINTLITRASKWAETYVGYPLSAASYRETLSGYGGRRMSVSHSPVRSVTGFWDTTSTESATTMLSSEYKVDLERGFFERDAGWSWDAPAVPQPFAIPLATGIWPGEERAPWLADYVAGYTLDGLSTDSDNYSTAGPGGTTSTGRTLPADIEDAVAQRAADLYNGDLGVIEEKVGDLMVKHALAGGKPVDPSKELLDAYRSVI